MPRVNTKKSVYFEHQKNQPWQQGRIVESNDRNYVVQNNDGTQYKRNRTHIRPTGVEVTIRDISPPRTSETPNMSVNSPSVTVNSEKPTQNINQPVPMERPERPKREIKQPSYLKDYVRY